MPLSPVTFKSFSGLYTNVNYLDNTKISGNVLLDCMNVQFLNDGVLTSRHGHIDFAVPFIAEPIRSALWKSLEFPYIESGNQAAYVIGGSTNSPLTVVSLSGSTVTTKLVQYKGTPSGGLVPASTSLDSDWLAPHYYEMPRIYWGQKQGRWYFNAANGLYRENLVDQLDSSAGIYSKYVLPRILALTPAVKDSLATAKTNWFEPGYACKVTAIVVEYSTSDDNQGFLESVPAFKEYVANIETLQSITVTPQILVYNKRNLNNLYLQIYRTKQYKIGEAEEVDYYLCNEVAVTKGSYNASTGVVTFSEFELPLNDIAISGQTPLYTNETEEGITSFPVSPPASNDFLIYKNYGIYAGIYRPAYVEVNMTALPATNDTITIEDITKTYGSDITIVSNDTTAPSGTDYTNGILTLQQLTYKGADRNAVPLVIRAFDPSSSLPSDNKYCTAAYAKSAAQIVVVGTAANKTIKITPTAGFFDTTQFQAPGIIALIKTDTGDVYDLVTYQDFEKITNSGVIEFYECVSTANFTTAPYTGATACYVFYLPGSSVDTLSVYKIGSTPGTTYSKGFSLVPMYEEYSSTKATPYFDIPVGTTFGPHLATSYIKTYIDLVGVYHKSPARLLDENVQNTIKTFQSSLTSYYPMIISYDTFAKFSLVSSLVGYTSNPFTSIQVYDFIRLSKTGTVSFDLNITNSLTNFSEIVSIPNGIVLSKQGRIESVPFKNVQAPLKVGDDRKRILRTALSIDQLYVFKETEGIYRIDLSGINEQSELIPVLVDNTTWLISPDSVQILDDCIVFLSNRGVMMIYNGQVVPLSTAIESDIITSITPLTKFNIASFKNTVRRQYGLCVGTYTYVFNFNNKQWTKWDLAFGLASVWPSGQLVTQQSEVKYYVPSTYNFIKYDRYITNNYNDSSDQIDEQIILTGSTFSLTSQDLTISRNTFSGRFGNIGNIGAINQITSKTIWYYDVSASTYYKAIYKTDTSGSVTITFTNSIPAAFSTSDYLLIGVNVQITPHRFFAGGPDTLSQFSKWVAQVQGSVTEMTSTFDVDTTSVTFSGQVLSFTTVNETAITDIPRNQARGRWITCKITHSYPFEYFNLLGLTWVAKDLDTFRIRFRN